MSATNVLAFPVAVICRSCGKASSEDELGECFTCGERFCGSAKTQCKALCSCDRLALELADRLADLRPSIIGRLTNRVRAAFAV
jgi:hypothetical protein